MTPSSTSPERLPEPPQFDAYAGSYADEVNRSLAILGGVRVDYFSQVKAGYLLDLVAAHFGRSEDVALLDVGCGTGTLHPLIAGRLRAVSGTDVSHESLAVAERANPAVAYRGYDGARLPYDDDAFDAVATVCVMHHVPPPQWPRFAAELRRVLRPGGLAMVFEHNPLNPLTRRIVSSCSFDADAVLLRQRRTRALLHDAGFRDVASRAILSVPSLGPATRRIDRALGRLGLGAQYHATGVA